MDKKVTAQEAAIAVLKKAEEMLKSSKLAKGMNDGKHQDNHTNNYDDATSAKGINQVLPKHVPGKGVSHGSSEMGNQVDKGNIAAAKATAKKTLGQMASQPKPNLPKSEGMPEQALAQPQDGTVAMSEEAQAPKEGGKGVHKLAKFMGHRAEKRKAVEPIEKSAARMDQHKTKQIAVVDGGDKSKVPGTKAKGTHDSLEPFSGDPMKDKSTHTKTLLGMSSAGANLAHGNKSMAADRHKETLSKLKSQPKPNLTKKEGE